MAFSKILKNLELLFSPSLREGWDGLFTAQKFHLQISMLVCLNRHAIPGESQS